MFIEHLFLIPADVSLRPLPQWIRPDPQVTHSLMRERDVNKSESYVLNSESQGMLQEEHRKVLRVNPKSTLRRKIFPIILFFLLSVVSK